MKPPHRGGAAAVLVLLYVRYSIFRKCCELTGAGCISLYYNGRLPRGLVKNPDSLRLEVLNRRHKSAIYSIRARDGAFCSIYGFTPTQTNDWFTRSPLLHDDAGVQRAVNGEQ